jgi:hypothetical protein
MHPQTMYQLATMKIAEEQAYAARQRLAREAREPRGASSAGRTDPSLLERLLAALRKTARPASRPSIDPI